ncbi:hybrid sensor histidine kinase/response regulator [Croceicoccus estronivorus]|uniref:hybrid sensor histidine kinase/response regulator n=1 Tax=Croceicoccus estronivorus TaxID=1172626 RepID=UPI00083728D6|nr:response regulator [Croceicoccus estronivorus]OCC23046.1 hybrid sensor histidine kinase/response regulator [Croceicoccus estronivorus]
MKGEMGRSARLLDVGLVGAGLVASVVMIWVVTREPAIAATFAGGLLVLGLAIYVLTRPRAKSIEPELAMPDWSVTIAAIGRADCGIAITDKANRLVCANETYVDWFGVENAPPALPLEMAGLERLAKAARMAWRDGIAEVDQLAGQEEHAYRLWRAEVVRAGRGEDHLVWRFFALVESDPLADLGERLAGVFGATLSRAGVEAVLVGPEGAIRASSPGFALRAAGDESATMAGQDFVALLRTDERDRIFFAREGREGTPQTLVHVALGDPSRDDPPAGGTPSSLMLLLDAGVGIGNGVVADGAGGTPQLEALLSQLPLGLAMTDRDGRFLFANAAFMRAAGIEGRGLPPYPSDLVVKEDKGALVDAVRRFAQGPASSGDMAVRLRRMADEPVSLGLAGVRGMGDAAVLLSLADTTEEARLKRQVAQATKMQAVGQLAGGVAHDFNNVLTAIIGYCDLMLLRHTPGDSDYDDIQQIRANSNRAASLTRQLLAFSRQQTLRPEVLQLPDVMSEVSQLLKRLMGEKILFKVHHDRELGPVRADPQQLEQVIINLAVNARDAMQARAQRSGGDGTGTLTMITRRIAAADVRRMKSDIIPIGDYTALIVEDTGGGIPPEHLGKIFEPFFTTKEKGKGTGLGLSTVYGIVKQSGGFIFVENVPGPSGGTVGARFIIYLPVHHTLESPSAAAKTEETSNWSGGGRVLLVEDEDMVRAVAERALARQGYEVTTAASGGEGLELVRGGGEFDLVVSDVVMPGMDGPAMAREIRKLVPDLPVLFMSGYAEAQLREQIDMADMHFIAKPFSVQQIGAKVGEVLGSRA